SRVVHLAAACVVASLHLSAQPLGPQGKTVLGASRTVLATVVDNRGRPIVDIDPDDFIIRETGQNRDVLSVRVADYPVALVLDNGRGTSKDFDAIRQAALRFVARIGRRPVAVALAEPPRLVATLDDDRQAVVQRIEKA